jgi:hypothetical protein
MVETADARDPAAVETAVVVDREETAAATTAAAVPDDRLTNSYI